jgi:hypothetical protein
VDPEEIDAEFDKIDNQVASSSDGDGLPHTVPIEQVYDLSQLDDIRAGKTRAIVIDDELELDSQAQTVVSWDPASLLHSLGV